MTFLILKLSNGSPSHSKEKLNPYHDLQASNGLGLQPQLWSHQLPLFPWLTLFIHTCLLAVPHICQICSQPQGLCTCCTWCPFSLLQQSLSREPISYSFILLRSLLKYQLLASPSHHPPFLFTALFFSINNHHLAYQIHWVLLLKEMYP